MSGVMNSIVFWIAVFIGSVFLIFVAAMVSRRTHKPTLLYPLAILLWNISTIAIPLVNQPNIHLPAYIAISIGTLLLFLFVIFWRDFFTGRSKKLGEELITTGMYRVVRHPIYAGHIFRLLGLSIIVGGALHALYFCVFFSGLEVAGIFMEEKHLEEEFGEEYQQYKRQVKWRLIPLLF